MSRTGASTRHRAAGSAALLVLAGLAVIAPSWGGLREPALVSASRTFQLSAPEPERYEWALTDGSAPGEQVLSRHSLLLERGELAGVALAPIAPAGSREPEVAAGQVLATLSLPRSERALAELRAAREALLAQRALLGAGAREAEVEQARRGLELARARLDRAEAVTRRLEALPPEGAVSEAERQDAELKRAERARAVDLAAAALIAARSPARPEAISEIDARLAAIDAGIAELEARLAEARIESPIAGVVDRGGGEPGVLLRVYELDPVYLHVPVDAAHYHRLRVGDPVRFVTASSPDREFRGELVAARAGASLLGGRSVVWVSVRVPNPRGLLRPGMIGEVELSPGAPGAWGVLPALQAAVDAP